MKKIALLVLSISLSLIAKSQVSKRAVDLRPNMTEEEVIYMMKKKPVKIDFYKNVVEFHYCTTGGQVDEFLALYFIDGKLTEMQNYSVSIRDTKGLSGLCKNFIKMGNYKEPESIQLIKMSDDN